MASVQLSVSRRHLEALFREGAVGVLTDGELLDRFVGDRGEAAEAAFAVLVERHAPMVLATCRQLLGDPHEAEDASQAAFLVLAKKARTIRARHAVGGWLHAVAVRIASKAKVAAARRRRREQTVAGMAARCETSLDPSDRWADLHRLIDALPDRLRLPIVLCYLEGLTHAEAARQLGWPLGTVESRLARGRERLRERLGTGGALATIAAPVLDRTPPSAAWIDSTARAAARFAAGRTMGTAVSSGVVGMAGETLRTMAIRQASLAMAGVLVAALAVVGAMRVSRNAPEEPARVVGLPAAPIADKPSFAPTTVKLLGRVVDPDGRPLPNAKLWLAFQGNDWTWSTRVPQVRATAGANGRFALSVSDDDPEVKRALRSTSGWPGGFGAIQLIATADGFGPSWVDLVGGAGGEVELRLVRDDVPIQGRLIGLEGQPLAGIEVRTLMVEIASSPEPIFGAPSGYFRAATTDADGRFRLAGIGRDRRAVLGIAGPGIQRDGLQVVTGSFPKDRPPHYRGYPVYSPKLEHPCKPGKSISGVVRDIDTGAPIAGIAVLNLLGTDAHTTTDHEGRYRLDGLPKLPEYHLSASARESQQPYIISRQVVGGSPGYEPVDADIGMVRGVEVTGRLIDRANGRPVQAWVAYGALRDNPHWRRVPGFDTRTGPAYPMPNHPSQADGSYRIVVPPGRGFLVAYIQYQPDRYLPAGIPSKRHPGAPADALDVRYDTVPFTLIPQDFPAVRPVEIAPGTKEATHDLVFDSGIVRTGRVLDPDGQPLTGVGMIGESHQNMNQFHPIDASSFAVSGLSTSPLLPRTLIFRHEARRLGKTLRVDGTEKGPLDIRLEPTASIAGRLLDAAGQPCEGIAVQVMRLVNEPTRGALTPFSPPIQATTDADGRFRIDGLVPGLVQWIHAAGFEGPAQGDLLRDWTPKSGENRDLGEIRRGGKK